MRILFVSNLYPPYAVGGYEQLCKEVAEAFVQCGHDVTVLTARHGMPKKESLNGVWVHRVLHQEVEGGMLHTAWRLAVSRSVTEKENVVVTTQLVEQGRPDAVIIWGMWNIPRSVPSTVESIMPGRTAYYFLDYWPLLPNAYIQRLEEHARSSWTRLPKSLVAALWLPELRSEQPPDLEFSHAICVSDAVRRALVKSGIVTEQASVIHLGIRPDEISTRSLHVAPRAAESLRVVYAGRLTTDKGVHTAIEAIEILRKSGINNVALDVYGKGNRGYMSRLRRMVVEQGLPVRFRGHVSRDQLLELLPSYDVLVFPSIWKEPFAHAVLEGMASGLVVVGTTSGGTGEVLVDGATGLVFEPGDARQLAEHLERLAKDSELRSSLGATARNRVLSEFTFAQTVNSLESFLAQMVSKSAAEHTKRTSVPSA